MPRSSLIVASVLVAAVASATAATPSPPATAVPPPSPVVIKLSQTKPDRTRVVQLFDGGGGLPVLGSQVSYSAGDWENALRSFHDLGAYETEIAQIDDLAATYVARKAGRKRALVLDVDETALSNYSAIDADDFTFGTHSQGEATNEIGVAIQPTLDLFNLAKAKGVAVFFVSERRENTRDHTTSNLQREGYSDWTQLILKPDDSILSNVEYKSGARTAIEQQGFRIIASVGDQYSDLAGGHEDTGFKLPNPFYFKP
ncbi:MAG TPA: HAD family acid phosphatase [Candidatus Binatia bacterium]|jgi:acid phosphatase